MASHRGWDIGALEVAKALSKSLRVKLYFATTSRLLIELNRSIHHPNLFSTLTMTLSKEEKKKIIETFYLPYRNTISGVVENEIEKNNEVIHISIHSFTPELNGVVRNADIGLLFDPSRENEKNFCKNWKKKIKAKSNLKVRFNYPYKGTADGFTTFLRKKFLYNYSGIELEVNNKLLIAHSSAADVTNLLMHTLKEMFVQK